MSKPVFVVPPHIRMNVLPKYKTNLVCPTRSSRVGKRLAGRRPIYVSDPSIVRLDGFVDEEAKAKFFSEVPDSRRILSFKPIYTPAYMRVVALWGGQVSEEAVFPIVSVVYPGNIILGEPAIDERGTLPRSIRVAELDGGQIAYYETAGNLSCADVDLYHQFSQIPSLRESGGQNFLFFCGIYGAVPPGLGPDRYGWSSAIGALYYIKENRMVFVNRSCRIGIDVATQSGVDMLARMARDVIHGNGWRMEE